MRDQACMLRTFENYSAAAGQGRRQLVSHLQQWSVAWCDRRHHAARLAQAKRLERHLVRKRRMYASVNLVDPSSEMFKKVSGEIAGGSVLTSEAGRYRIIQALQFREALSIRSDCVDHSSKISQAFARFHPGPWALVKGPPGRANGQVNIFSVGVDDGGYGFSTGGIDVVAATPAGPFAPLPTDENLRIVDSEACGVVRHRQS
jgi:hypothetical protein